MLVSAALTKARSTLVQVPRLNPLHPCLVLHPLLELLHRLSQLDVVPMEHLIAPLWQSQ